MAVGAGRIFAINLLANSKPAEDAFARVGQAAGRIPTPMKVAAAALTAVFAAVTVVATKSFKALLELGGEFNEVTRIIRVGTGAVGGDLEALEQSFRNVAAGVPSAFSDVAAVIAELDTRTDLAGVGLETMAEQLLTLSRLMGGDARTTTREVTRLFNRFGLEAEEATDMLDLLFRASQASGASVDRLASDVTKNAGALVGMGMSLEESIALFALFEREGVRSETVVRSLRSAFQRLTADGKPLREGLADIFTELKELDREAAVAKGLEIFGSQALELVDAVRDGRLSVEDFTKQLVEGGDTIIGVAEETDGWREALDKVRNFIKLQFEPVAREVFKNVTEFVDGLIPAAERVSKAFEEDGLTGAFRQFAVELKKIYEERIEPLFIQFLAFLDQTVKPIALELGNAIGSAIASGMWSAFKSGVSNLFGSKAGDRIMKGLGVTDDFVAAPAPSMGLTVLRQQFSLGGPGGFALPQTLQRPRGDADEFPNVPFMAAGGLVMGPTLAVIGEAGPEMVIPLDRAGGVGATYVTVNVSGADPQAVVEALRRYTRANGPLGSVVNV